MMKVIFLMEMRKQGKQQRLRNVKMYSPGLRIALIS